MILLAITKVVSFEPPYDLEAKNTIRYNLEPFKEALCNIVSLINKSNHSQTKCSDTAQSDVQINTVANINKFMFFNHESIFFQKSQLIYITTYYQL